jgi:hypothetical protein
MKSENEYEFTRCSGEGRMFQPGKAAYCKGLGLKDVFIIDPNNKGLKSEYVMDSHKSVRKTKTIL